ncbi:MAG: NFACT family protein [Clostridia bacterium]|nr:NFACT family protein [Clostridia bacterium]MBQ8893221.1 NFACT family protein [Clostridia bacterium]
MALDACFMTYLTREINSIITDARVEKVYQPGKDEIILNLRAPNVRTKLLFCCTPNCARITLTGKDAENPAQPPLFCMVLRKHLTGAKVERVYMPAFERAIFVEFTGKNDFFEPVKKYLVLEILGRTSNLVLMDEEQRIIECIRHVDITAGRQMLPGLKYEPVVPQDKKPFSEVSPEDLPLLTETDKPLWKAVMDTYSGISPIVARELAFRSAGRIDAPANGLTPNQKANLEAALTEAGEALAENRCTPTALREKETGRWLDFSFMPIGQYGESAEELSYPSPVALIEDYFEKSAEDVRLKQKTRDVEQLLTRTSARIERTMRVREKELEEGKKADHYRICGELLQANLHRAKTGMTEVTVENYYDNCKPFTIPLRPDKTPQQNAQLYFKKYNKAKTSARVVADLIRQDKEDLSYLDSVFMSLCDCETSADVDQIREELIRTGFSKNRRKNNGRAAAPSKPRKFISSTGFTILVGRNNVQNDQLTVKLSRKDDLWLHAKNIHSSHVLIQSGGREIDDETILEAASICAYYSKGKNAPKVEVDYCPVSHVRKPNGARPGMVVYENYYSVLVEPKLPKEENQ